MKPTYIRISKIVEEAPDFKTFYFDYELKSIPGQFIMLWIPRIDQKPFSPSFNDEKILAATVFKRGGDFTEELFKLKEGDRIGLSGPFGKGFTIKEKMHYIIVAGGYGVAPLRFLANEVVKRGSTVDFCMGSRNSNSILFEKELESLKSVNVHIATDDGSRGHKGFVTDLVKDIVKKDIFPKMVCTCGPEGMEKKVLDICNEANVDCEISMERYMKCGFGVCGQCTVDPLGVCMCKEGPVINRELANQITEFGKYHRGKSGGKENI